MRSLSWAVFKQTNARRPVISAQGGVGTGLYPEPHGATDLPQAFSPIIQSAFPLSPEEKKGH